MTAVNGNFVRRSAGGVITMTTHGLIGFGPHMPLDPSNTVVAFVPPDAAGKPVQMRHTMNRNNVSSVLKCPTNVKKHQTGLARSTRDGTHEMGHMRFTERSKQSCVGPWKLSRRCRDVGSYDFFVRWRLPSAAKATERKTSLPSLLYNKYIFTDGVMMWFVSFQVVDVCLIGQDRSLGS